MDRVETEWRLTGESEKWSRRPVECFLRDEGTGTDRAVVNQIGQSSSTSIESNGCNPASPHVAWSVESMSIMVR